MMSLETTSISEALHTWGEFYDAPEWWNVLDADQYIRCYLNHAWISSAGQRYASDLGVDINYQPGVNYIKFICVPIPITYDDLTYDDI